MTLQQRPLVLGSDGTVQQFKNRNDEALISGDACEGTSGCEVSGEQNKCYGVHSAVSKLEGNSNINYGQYSHMEGDTNKNLADINHVEGKGNFVSGDCVHVEGINCIVGDNYVNYTTVDGINLIMVGDHSAEFLINNIISCFEIGGVASVSVRSVVSSSTYDGTTNTTVVISPAITGTLGKCVSKLPPPYYHNGHAEGYGSQAKGRYSHAQGINALARKNGQSAECSALSGILGQNQLTRYVMGVSSNNSMGEAFADGRFVIPTNCTFGCTITLVGRTEISHYVAMYKRMVLISNFGGTISISSVETIGVDIANANLNFIISGDNTNKSLKFQVQSIGEVGLWTIVIEAVEVWSGS